MKTEVRFNKICQITAAKNAVYLCQFNAPEIGKLLLNANISKHLQKFLTQNSWKKQKFNPSVEVVELHSFFKKVKKQSLSF